MRDTLADTHAPSPRVWSLSGGSHHSTSHAAWALSLLVQPLQRQSTDARVEDVERVHRLPPVARRLGRSVLGAVAVLSGESATHPLYLALEGHLRIVRVDALGEGKVLVHHVAPKVHVAHAQQGRAVRHVRRADLALGKGVVDRDALEAVADAPGYG